MVDIEPPFDLKVPKRRVTVELALQGSTPRQVEVFVAEQQAHAVQKEDVLNLLESEQAFLPAFDLETKTGTLFNKDTVLWVGIQLAEQGDELEQELFDNRRSVEVEVVGGTTLQGNFLYTAPSMRARVVDFLNHPGRFVRLWSEERLYLVNKSYVLRILELGQSRGA